jgi:uncharacterized membrane protein
LQLEQARTQESGTGHYWALSRDFAWLLAVGLLLLALILLGEYALLPPAVAIPLGILRLLMGLAYILYAPGYCLTAALFPAADDLDGIERAGLSLGLSVAWVSILALVLDRLPWGLRLWPIFFGELLSMLLFMAFALWRRARQPRAMAYAPQMDWRPRPWWGGLPRLEKRVCLLCAGALIIAGLAAAWVFLVPSPDEFMTEFYILGKEGLAEDYPREALVGEEVKVTMGIGNLEREPMRYTVEVWAVDPWGDKRELINTMGPFSLEPEQSVEQPVFWSMPWAGDDQIVEFLLYAGGQEGDEPYRLLRLWMNVMEGEEDDAAAQTSIVVMEKRRMAWIGRAER